MWSCELEEKIKRRLKSDTCWACQFKSIFDSYKRKQPRSQKGFDGIKRTTLTGHHAASGGPLQMNAPISLPMCLRAMHSVDCLGFPQLLESRGPVPWAESLLSFLSTAFQRKRDHLRGDSGRFWVLAQISGQKKFPLPQRQVNRIGKRNFFPYTSVLFGILSFFRNTVMEIHLSLFQEKENRVKNYFPGVIFFFFFDCLPYSLSYDRDLWSIHTHRSNSYWTTGLYGVITGSEYLIS